MTEHKQQGIRAVVVTNPASGRGAARDSVAAAIDRLRQHGLDVTIVQGGSAAESLTLTQQAIRDGAGLVAVAGGDGLVTGLLPAVAGTSVPLGLIPVGTGNDLAREFGIPLDDPHRAADIIAAEGRVRRIDLGKLGETWFATVIAGGFDAKVNQRANTMRWPAGRMRYNAAIAVEFAALRPISYRIEIDDQPAIETSAVIVAIGNTSTYGGGMRICAAADPSDGLLDVTVIHAVGRIKLAMLLRHMYEGGDHPAVSTYRARSVTLSAQSPVAAFADGEPRGQLPFTARAVPAALSLLVPGK